MSDERIRDEDGRGVSGFLRSLFAGIPFSERAEGEEELLLDPPPGGSLRVDNANGRTQVHGEDREDIRIEVHKTARAATSEDAERLVEDIQILAREDGAGALDIEVDIPGRWNRKGRADLDLYVPRELAVVVAATNGRVCVSGLRAQLKAKASNGAIKVHDVVGDIEIHTSNAKVHTDCTCGKLLARSSNGNIKLSAHKGSVDAGTSNGAINCELECIGKQGVTLVTSNGRISLQLPEECDCDVDVRVDNGLIRTHRELDRSGSERSGRLRGTLGRGGTPVRLRASNGAVTLR